MTITAARGANIAASAGTWASTANAHDGAAGTNPATYATWTSSTSGAVASLTIGGYGFDSTIPADAVLASVTASVRHLVSATARFASVTVQAFDGATAIGSPVTLTLSTSAHNDTADLPVTLAQLRSSTFRVRVTATRAAVTQSATFSLDYADVTVDWSPAPTMPAPLFGQFDGTPGFSANTTPRTATVTSQAGDLLVVIALAEDAGTVFGTPAGKSLTYTPRVNESAANRGRVAIWTALDPTGGTSWALTLAASGVTDTWGMTVLLFRGVEPGAVASANNATADFTVTLTTTAANSTAVAAVSDWQAISNPGRVWSTVNSYAPSAANGGERVYAHVSGNYTVYAGMWPNTGAAGAKTLSVTRGTTGGWSMGALELKPVGGGDARSGGSTAAVTAAASGAGAKRVSRGVTATVTVTAAGTGSRRSSGGVTAQVSADALAGGVRRAVSGSTATVTVAATGAGVRVVRAGSTATVQVASVGGGAAARRGSSATSVAVDPVGGGTSARAGGSTAVVAADPAGSGATTRAGGAAADMTVTAAGAGITARAGGAVTVVAVTATGGGFAEQDGHADGGSVTAVTVTATAGAGRAARAGGSTTSVATAAAGGGRTTRRSGATATARVTATGGGLAGRRGSATTTVRAAAAGGGAKTARSGSPAAVSVAAGAAGARGSAGGQVTLVEVTASGGGVVGRPLRDITVTVGSPTSRAFTVGAPYAVDGPVVGEGRLVPAATVVAPSARKAAVGAPTGRANVIGSPEE